MNYLLNYSSFYLNFRFFCKLNTNTICFEWLYRYSESPSLVTFLNLVLRSSLFRPNIAFYYFTNNPSNPPWYIIHKFLEFSWNGDANFYILKPPKCFIKIISLTESYLSRFVDELWCSPQILYILANSFIIIRDIYLVSASVLG